MKELTIDAVIENIETVTAFVNAELEAIGCPMKAQIQLDVAIDELFGNIAIRSKRRIPTPRSRQRSAASADWASSLSKRRWIIWNTATRTVTIYSRS